MPLGQALRKYVQPGLTLHLGITSTPPTAIIYELTRLFRGKDPRFTLVTLGLTTVYSMLVHSGLLEKVITTWRFALATNIFLIRFSEIGR
jgi:3-oxoacid CoA-transferase subunit A